MTRISPMTTYHLRKLFNDKQTQLIWNHKNQGYPADFNDFLKQVMNDELNSSISLEVLEKLVMLYQTLALIYEKDSPQVLDIEFQIYGILGIQPEILSKSDQKKVVINEQLTPERCNYLLKKLKELRTKCDTLIGPKITSYFLSTLILEQQKKSDLLSPNPFSMMALDSILSKIDDREINELISREMIEKRGFLSDQEIPSQSPKQNKRANAEAGSSKRIWVLLKQFNALQTHWESLIGQENAFICLIKSRPTHNWCLLFDTSQLGSVSYSGNMQELIPRSRLNIYEEWTQNFIKNCESYY